MHPPIVRRSIITANIHPPLDFDSAPAIINSAANSISIIMGTFLVEQSLLPFLYLSHQTFRLSYLVSLVVYLRH